MSDNITVKILSVTEAVTAYEREAHFLGPDDKVYTVHISYAGEWNGYNETEWYDAEHKPVATPAWASDLDDFDIDELTRQDGE